MSSVAQSWLFATPWTVAHQALLAHGIFQARILEGVAISSSRGSSPPRDQACVSCISCIDRQANSLPLGGEGDDRGWDGWMASPTRRAWVWVNSGSWWWTGRPGMLQFIGSQRVRHNWATEWTEYHLGNPVSIYGPNHRVLRYMTQKCIELKN